MTLAESSSTATAEKPPDLAALDAFLEAHKVHPIVKPVLFLLQTPEGAWHPDLADGRLERLEQLVEEARASKTIVLAMWDLLKLSLALHRDLKIGRGALELFAFVNRTIEKYDLVAAVRKSAEMDPAKRDAAAEMIGKEGKIMPAKVGDKPPVGSLRPDQLTPGKRRI